MSFLRRLFSSDYRRAVAAEAAGDYLEAARAWALTGNRAKVAEMHVLRAERAATRGEEMEALRDALRWADDGTEPRRRASRALAAAIVAKVDAEGLATERDRDAMREAAKLYEDATEFRQAGATWERIGDDDAAARAYERGGVVDKMELALARDEKRDRDARRLRGAFEEYELHLRGGDREAALSSIRLCCELAEAKGEYRRLRAELERRRIANGRVSLRRRDTGVVVVACAGPRVTIGRQPTCDLALRSAGVSRVHAEIVAGERGFALRDAGSRRGTLIGGMPVEGEVPLADRGSFTLGDDAEIAWSVDGSLRLSVSRGLDKGVVARVAAPGALIDLQGDVGLAATLEFREGRPYVTARAGRSLRLSGTRVPRGIAQLVRDDVLAIDDAEAEVL